MATRHKPNKNLKQPTLRSLTTQISGVKKWTNQELKNGKDGDRMERDFDAAYQESKRVRNTLADFANVKTLRAITEKNEKALVDLLKRMHFQGDLRDVYETIRTAGKLPKSDAKRLLTAVNAMVLNHYPDLPEKHRKQLELQQTVAETQAALEKYSVLLYGDDCTIDHGDTIVALNELKNKITASLNTYHSAYKAEETGPTMISYEEVRHIQKSLRMILGEVFPRQN